MRCQVKTLVLNPKPPTTTTQGEESIPPQGPGTKPNAFAGNHSTLSLSPPPPFDRSPVGDFRRDRDDTLLSQTEHTGAICYLVLRVEESKQ